MDSTRSTLDHRVAPPINLPSPHDTEAVNAFRNA